MLNLWSESLREAIEQEVVGQRRAVRSVVRTLVRGAAGMADGGRPRGVFLFLGPTGTGKTHLTRVLGRVLHGPGTGIVDLDGTLVSPGQGWAALRQAALALAHQWGSEARPAPVFDTLPNAILVIDRPEEAPSDLNAALLAALDRGQVPLGGGGAVSLANVLVILTSGLCAREIFELSAAHIGFRSRGDNENDEIDEKIFDLCRRAAEAYWGPSFLGRTDAVIVFHRFRADHLPAILEQRLRELAAFLGRRGVVLLVEESARTFLIEKGLKDVRFGARQLDRALRQFLEYPLSDLLLSGGLAGGQLATVRAAASELAIDITPLAGPVPLPADFLASPQTA
jgi:ATP-dependent Clp protease ATP-binding subunit ClpA